MTGQRWRSTGLRWLKFNLVGGIGIVMQLAILIVLKTGLGLDYLVATVLAVEGAVVHNFLWHQQFTWKERPPGDRRADSWARLMKFNLTTGALSIAENLLFMKALAGLGHMNFLLANAITIAACSVLNFLVSENFVFAEARENQSM
jgi:putative flippase GtrA